MKSLRWSNQQRAYDFTLTAITERFEWKRTMPKSQENAKADMRDIERMGYKSLIVDHEQSMKVGVPETYEA